MMPAEWLSHYNRAIVSSFNLSPVCTWLPNHRLLSALPFQRVFFFFPFSLPLCSKLAVLQASCWVAHLLKTNYITELTSSIFFVFNNLFSSGIWYCGNCTCIWFLSLRWSFPCFSWPLQAASASALSHQFGLGDSRWAVVRPCWIPVCPALRQQRDRPRNSGREYHR